MGLDLTKYGDEIKKFLEENPEFKELGEDVIKLAIPVVTNLLQGKTDMAGLVYNADDAANSVLLAAKVLNMEAGKKHAFKNFVGGIIDIVSKTAVGHVFKAIGL